MNSSVDPVRDEEPPAGPSTGIDKAVVAWAILVFALLLLGLAPLYILHPALRGRLGQLAARGLLPPTVLIN
jgi:hypothetical protein